MTLPNMAEVAQALSHVPVYTKKLLEMRKDMDDITNVISKPQPKQDQHTCFAPSHCCAALHAHVDDM